MATGGLSNGSRSVPIPVPGPVACGGDFGDITSGDPATDLGLGWMLFPSAERETFLALATPDPATRAPGRGWALGPGLAILASSADNARMAKIGRTTIDRVLGNAAGP